MGKGKSSKVCNAILILMGILWVFPVVFALLGSMKAKQEYNMSFFWQLAKSVQWKEHLAYISKYSNIFSSVANSLLYSLVGAGGAVVLSALAAFAIAKLNIRRRMFWFMFIYSGTIFPFQMYLIPVFRAYLRLHLYDTRGGLMLFYTAICIPFSMFVLRNHFLNIPNEIIDAARIDGAPDRRILTQVMLPMSKSSLAVVFLTQFSWCYNELMFGITFTNSNIIKPIMAALSVFTGHTPAMLTACFIVSVPTILLYALLNRNFETGIVYTSK